MPPDRVVGAHEPDDRPRDRAVDEPARLVPVRDADEVELAHLARQFVVDLRATYRTPPVDRRCSSCAWSTCDGASLAARHRVLDPRVGDDRGLVGPTPQDLAGKVSDVAAFR
jgi:hypothetical protein